MTDSTILGRPEVFVRTLADLGEGPVWDARTNRLCWVDITAGTLHEVDAAGEPRASWKTGTMLGAAAPLANQPGFAVAVEEGFGLLIDGHLRIDDPVLSGTDHRMNDAKCDSSGRMWAGSLSKSGDRATGVLRRWTGGHASEIVRDGFHLPNGIGWSPDDSTMYFVDSLAHTVYSAPFDPDEGWPGDFTEFARVDNGLPDGLAVDSDGNIWVAVWDGSEVRCISPHGDLLGVVPMPVTRPTSCAFGPDGTLYITTARTELPPSVLERKPEAGAVFAMSTATTGVPVHPFAS